MKLLSETRGRRRTGLDEAIAFAGPWLADFGSWIFGALIALNLVILGAVLTIGPVDEAVKIATAATAMALPPGGAGVLLLRVLTDVHSIRRSRSGAHVSHEAAGKLEEEALSDSHPESRQANLVALRYTVGLLLVTVLLTLVGLTAASWHAASWIAIAFMAMVGASAVTLVLAVSQLRALVPQRHQRGGSGAAERDQKGA